VLSACSSKPDHRPRTSQRWTSAAGAPSAYRHTQAWRIH
jgi:hypothetical protein